jgi:uncharacterized membrane-anchored protein
MAALHTSPRSMNSKASRNTTNDALSKVPELTLVFWLLKITATTLGETGGDAVSMSMNLGYLVGTEIFSAIFIIAVIAQISAKRFHPVIYWTTIIATTTVTPTNTDHRQRRGVTTAATVTSFGEIESAVVSISGNPICFR